MRTPAPPHRPRILWLAPWLGVALLLGCAGTQSTPPKIAGCKTYSEQRAASEPSAMGVSLLSPELAEVIGIESAVPGSTSNGLPQIQVALYNCSDVDVMAQARTQFGGKSGQSEPASAWRTVHLPPRGRAVYAENGISDKTSTMFVEIHDLNRGQSQFAPGQTYLKP